ncbi:MAG: CBS domain-containing protein, partial [Myxococcales bacterium]|nr:CBS domain-containing protein [Myxococcales bacterium]
MQATQTVRRWMTPAVRSVHANDSIDEAIDLVVRVGQSVVPVVDEADALRGILSDRSLLRWLANRVYTDDGTEVSAGDRAVLPPRVLSPDDDLFSAVQAFLETAASALPVVHEGRLVAMLGRREALAGVQLAEQEHVRQNAKRRKQARLSERRPQSIERMQQVVADNDKEQVVA